MIARVVRLQAAPLIGNENFAQLDQHSSIGFFEFGTRFRDTIDLS